MKRQHDSINGNKYKFLTGSRRQVHNKTAHKTKAGLTRKKFMLNKRGPLAKHRTAKKENVGYFAKKGKFGYIKKSGRMSRKMNGGGGSQSRVVPPDIDITPEEKHKAFQEKIRKAVQKEKDEGYWPMKTDLSNLTEDERIKKRNALSEILEELRQEEEMRKLEEIRKLEEQAIESSLNSGDKRPKPQNPSGSKKSKTST